MNIPATIDSNFERVLKKLQNILEGNIASYNDKDIAEFLMHAEGHFRSWKLFFNLSYLNNIQNLLKQNNTQSKYLTNFFCDMIKEYLPENGNGSWSKMENQETTLCSNYVKLIDSFIDILNYKNFIFPDYDDVKRLLSKFVINNSPSHISGMGTLLATSILFIHDENHFMVLDSPVKKYFNVTDDKDAIDNYDKIITYSQSLAAKYKLSMWTVNKAYGVFMNGGKIKIFDFCNNSNFRYITI